MLDVFVGELVEGEGSHAGVNEGLVDGSADPAAASTNHGGETMREEQMAALQHALDALSDGAGHPVWGPGPVGHKLYVSGAYKAAEAFDEASITLTRVMDTSALISSMGRPRFIANMKKLAPVLLDILLPPEE